MTDQIVNRKAVYIREKTVVESYFLRNPHISLSIAKDSHFQTLIGYIINKRKTKTRDRIYHK